MTTGSWGIDPDTRQFKIIRGSRVVSTTDGTLINLLSDLVELNDVSVDFPDPANKDYAYAFHYRQDRNILTTPDSYIQLNTCQTFFTRRPEEYSANQNLIAAPAGADIFVGQMRISRTTNPSHTWLEQTLGVLPKTDAWIPMTGSTLMEAALGISRAMHVFISGGNLVLQREMSISTGAGGYGSYGTIASPAADNIEGSELLYNVGAGVPAWTSTSSPYKKSDSDETQTDSALGPPNYEIHRISGSDPCSTTDPTNYRSIYSIDFRGHFGRRS